VSFPRYPKYKPSGVEWLGEVPEHWGVVPLKHAARLTMGQSPSSEECNTEGLGVPFLQGCAEFGSISPLPRVFCPVATKYAEHGDILFSVRAPVGKLNVADRRFGIGRGLCAIHPTELVESRFLTFGLQELAKALLSVATGSTYESVSIDQVGGCALLLPPPSEQRAIAAFLDRETAKIDALIAEQEKLIELLAEKRQAVISHAVTRGLNPDAPMKPSGIEWLGDVPEHWVTRKLSFAFNTIGSGTTPRSDNLAYYEPGDIPWVNTGDLTDGDLPSCERRISRLAIEDYPSLRVYPAGSLLVAMYGATTGKLGLLGFDATVNQACCAFVGNDCIRTRFLFYWLLGYRAQLISLASGGGQPNISQEVLRGLRVAAPELSEQRAIAAFLDRETAKIDTLVTEAESAITLLQERRSALISAAVTGQIDVRNVVATEVA